MGEWVRMHLRSGCVLESPQWTTLHSVPRFPFRGSYHPGIRFLVQVVVIMPLRYVYEDALGARGQGELRFLKPAAVAALGGSRQETLIVSDTGNHRLQLLHPSGQMVRSIGGPTLTHADGRTINPGLRYPMGVDSEDDGSTIIVSDMANNRILRLRTSDGAVLANATSWQQTFGQVAQPLLRPRGLALHMQLWPPYGTLPILFDAASGNNRIVTYALAPLSPATIALPGVIATASDARMIPLNSFGQSGNGASDMAEPAGVCAGVLADADFGFTTRVFVADPMHNRVQEWRFHPQLTNYEHVHNILGTAPALFQRPSAVALLPAADRRAETSRLFVTESQAGRVQMLDANGHALQVLVPPARATLERSNTRPLAGIGFARRRNADPSADSHRLVMAGGAGYNRLFVFRREWIA